MASTDLALARVSKSTDTLTALVTAKPAGLVKLAAAKCAIDCLQTMRRLDQLGELTDERLAELDETLHKLIQFVQLELLRTTKGNEFVC